MFIPTDPDDPERSEQEFHLYNWGQIIAASIIAILLLLLDLLRAFPS